DGNSRNMSAMRQMLLTLRVQNGEEMDLSVLPQSTAPPSSTPSMVISTKLPAWITADKWTTLTSSRQLQLSQCLLQRPM
ncbi:hypothetical protein XENORESO_016801, partial [Xenotaenia resolanae]